MAEDRRVDQLRVPGVDAHAGDVPRVGEAGVLPGLAGVGRLPHPVARGDVAAHRLLAGAGVDHVGVPLGDRHGADRAAEEAVRDALPGVAAVRRLPHPAAGRAEVVEVGLARHPGHRCRPATPVGPDLAPVEAREEGRVHDGLGLGRRLLGLGAGGFEAGNEEQGDERDGEGEDKPGTARAHATILLRKVKKPAGHRELYCRRRIYDRGRRNIATTPTTAPGPPASGGG